MEAQSPSTCNQCGKKFQRKAHLLRHQQQRELSRVELSCVELSGYAFNIAFAGFESSVLCCVALCCMLSDGHG